MQTKHLCVLIHIWILCIFLSCVCYVFVVSNCEFVTFPLVYWVRFGTCCIDSWSLHPYLLCWASVRPVMNDHNLWANYFIWIKHFLSNLHCLSKWKEILKLIWITVSLIARPAGLHDNQSVSPSVHMYFHPLAVKMLINLQSYGIFWSNFAFICTSTL